MSDSGVNDLDQSPRPVAAAKGSQLERLALHGVDPHRQIGEAVAVEVADTWAEVPRGPNLAAPIALRGQGLLPHHPPVASGNHDESVLVDPRPELAVRRRQDDFGAAVAVEVAEDT